MAVRPQYGHLMEAGLFLCFIRLPLLSTYDIHKLYVLLVIIVEKMEMNKQHRQAENRIIFTRFPLNFLNYVVCLMEHLMIWACVVRHGVKFNPLMIQL